MYDHNATHEAAAAANVETKTKAYFSCFTCSKHKQLNVLYKYGSEHNHVISPEIDIISVLHTCGQRVLQCGPKGCLEGGDRRGKKRSTCSTCAYGKDRITAQIPCGTQPFVKCSHPDNEDGTAYRAINCSCENYLLAK